MYKTPLKKNLFELLSSENAKPSDKKRWKELLLDMSGSTSVSVPSSGLTGSWWTVTVAIITVLVMVDRITNYELESTHNVLNILDGTLGGVENEIRGYNRYGVKNSVTNEENNAYTKLRLILIKCGISSKVFKTTKLTNNMSLKELFYVGKLKDHIHDFCNKIGTRQSKEALKYFNNVLKEHYKMTSMFDAGMKGRRLSYT